eukprot:CAMPEP_0178438624 /NCGR_PEP_ID=MMETSP0689_2-20121128/35695_1 /TAXON_ID=160604 /ORGANISM="Amphidinium massartii, Strain CS-259" /LENGTH=314 /DNA_ID=CAMNT_0020061045 /DNA_START=35 /DNA_END=975 /DNA_ORIENTATION=+
MATTPLPAGRRLSALVRRPGCRWQAFQRRFATTVFNIPPSKPSSQEQVLFLLGLNEKKFFGRDSSEEGLKLLERIAEHDAQYTLLLGISPALLKHVEANHAVKDRRLTSSRKLEKEEGGELIPLIQASSIDSRPKVALDRPRKITGERLCQRLCYTPSEGRHIYWAWFSMRQYRDAAKYEFWHKYFPTVSLPYFEQRAEHIALKAIEHLATQRAKGREGSALLVVGNDLYALVAEVLKKELTGDPSDALSSKELAKYRQERLLDLDTERHQIEPLLVHTMFIYVVVPGLIFLQLVVAANHFFETTVRNMWRADL